MSELNNEAVAEPGAASANDAAGGRPAAGTDTVGQQPGQETDWAEILPEGLREGARSVGSPEALAEALKRGMEYKPFANLDEVKLSLPEPDEGEEPVDFGWLKGLAVEKGMTQPMLDSLVKGYASARVQAMESMKAGTESSLKKEYGTRYTEVMARAEDACKKINEVTGGKLGTLLKSGIGNDEGFIRAMIFVSEAISESSLPGNPAGVGAVAMSTKEFIEETFNQAKQPNN